MESALAACTNSRCINNSWMYGLLSSKSILDNALNRPLSLSKNIEFGDPRGARNHPGRTATSDGAKITFRIVAKLGRGGKSGNNGDNRFRFGRPFANGNSGSGSPVPSEQQPVNEYQSLLDSVLFSWVMGDMGIYTLKLSAIGTAVTVLLGWPVMASMVDPEKEFLKCGIGAICGGLLAVTLATLRMYLGWAYVGNRLFSATVEYEETGWYDGEIWIKPPEVLARDRLLGSYKVKPALTRVKITLVALAASLVTCTAFFFTLPNSDGDEVSVVENVDEPSDLRSGSSYSDDSAHKFEPHAFAGEGESLMPDYCR